MTTIPADFLVKTHRKMGYPFGNCRIFPLKTMNDQIVTFEGDYGGIHDGKYTDFNFTYENPIIHSFETHITEDSVEFVF